MKPLHSKIALITGASQGLGRAVAMALAASGAEVIVNYHPSQENAANDVVAHIQQEGGHAVLFPADVTSLEQLRQMYAFVQSTYGQLDILINNAGVMSNGPLESVTEADFDRHFAVNVKGTYFNIQLAVPLMKPGARILNFSSSVTGQMYANYSIYAATKGAIDQLTRHLAKELGPKGISINAIAPGPSNTDMFVVGRSDAQLAMTKANIAAGRLGEPSDIASLVLMLLTEPTGWIQGQTIKANGGFI